MTIELTVLGASGSYPSASAGASSGYLVRVGSTALWIDCGSGTFANLQRHLPVDDLTAVVVTHRHADHCADIYALQTLLQWYRGESTGPPVLAPVEVLGALEGLSSGIGTFFAWDEISDGDERTIGEATLRFSRTDHPPPTVAVEVSTDDKRLIYTSDTGPQWSVSAFGPGADVVVSEATYQEGSVGEPVHLTAAQAGEAARVAAAKRLVITHLAPLLDPQVSVAEAEAAYGAPVTLAAIDLRVRM